MVVGIPNGLLYFKYSNFILTFFKELGADVLVSPDTNKDILNLGVNSCVDDACLPVKVFHGHVEYLKDKVDCLFVPRIMKLYPKEFICPKFCGLPEMIKNNITDVPKVLDYPLYADNEKKFRSWALNTGSYITKNRNLVKKAFIRAVDAQKQHAAGIDDTNFAEKIALVGHPYNVYDKFSNMDLVKKLHKLEIGVITEEKVEEMFINEEISMLFKKPFWTFARNSFGFASYIASKRLADGIIYISSFSCGIDSIVIELIKETCPDFPMLVLKIDEETGEAGFNTRLEAFKDLLSRRVVCA